MIHGGGQTASNFLGTPDGRRGWADDFVANGYAVYVVDQSGRGRSGFFGDSYGKTRKPRSENVEQRFTAPERKQLWPQASLHTQWPGTDAAFDAFLCQPGRDHRRRGTHRADDRDAGAKLLDRIGPAVLLTHSQAGVIGWSMADERPHLVKGILAVEPSGRRSARPSQKVRPEYFENGAVRAPLGCHAREKSCSTRRRRRRANSSSCGRSNQMVPGSSAAFCRPSRPRQIPHLRGIPILILVSESSYPPRPTITARPGSSIRAGVKEFIRQARRSRHPLGTGT